MSSQSSFTGKVNDLSTLGPPKGSRQDSSSVNTLPRGDRTKAPVTPAPSRATTAGRTRSAISPRVPTVTVTRTTDPSVVTNLTRPQTGASNYSFRHMPVDGTSSSHAHGTFSNLRSSSSQSTSIRPKSAYSKYKEDEDLAASKPFRYSIKYNQNHVTVKGSVTVRYSFYGMFISIFAKTISFR